MAQDIGKCNVFQLSDTSLRELLLTANLCHWMAISFLYVI